MIPSSFTYQRAGSVEEALSLASEHGDDAKFLAGGHSLLPLMKLRLAAPTLLVDIRKVPGLRGVDRANGGWRVGAMTRHADLQTNDDLGIVARVAHRVSVMYAGEVVESAPTAELFANPKHPYTKGLLRCVPVPGTTRRDEPLGSIPGTVPRIGPGFEGCAFRERCDFADETCRHVIPRHHASAAHEFLCRLPA